MKGGKLPRISIDSMSLLGQNTCFNLRLLSRNEGKIKSYDSCCDVRAWSHDLQERNCYLREWIKRDMPICVLPVCTLANFLRIMTCRSRAKTTPRCHPDCKSKVLLESICKSCHAIKECLKDDPNFDKYFAEEEFETSHWPCDKCLEVLKNIKMFWKIIIEKIFGINISKAEEFVNIQDSRTDSVKSVAKLWEQELVQQALFVKNVTPLLSKNSNIYKNEFPWRQSCNRKETTTRIPRPCKFDDKKPPISTKLNKVKSPTASIISQRTRCSNTGQSDYNMSKQFVKTPLMLHKCTSIRVRMGDKACETCYIEKENLELTKCKKEFELLQQKCKCQDSEMEKLRTENNTLKIELQNFYNNCNWRSVLQLPIDTLYDNGAVIPKPFESCIDDSKTASYAKNTDSEMIITMKNCKNESFRHVSLLQVLHKTNGPVASDERMSPPCSKKENPIDVLTKVQYTFGEIVRREKMLVNNQRHSAKHSDIDASFCQLKNSRSAPSCSTICSECPSSDSNFMRL